MASSTSLSDLVDFPMERLHAEYKSAIDLSMPLNRAKLARHICAIANHGGGYIAFGINDDYSPTHSVNPYPFTLDDISGIIKKYLEPAIQCELRIVLSKTGQQHEVIVVPPHGAIPICAKANGPEINGKISGIFSGTHYLRKVGPESAAIVTAADWAPVIRRCALHDRAAILNALGAVIDSNPSKQAHGQIFELSKWKSATLKQFESKITPDTPLDLGNNHIVMSYLIESPSTSSIATDRFIKHLREIGFEVEFHVRTGWSMFYIFDRAPIWPVWYSDIESGLDEEDFLQTSMLAEKDTFGLDFWRASPRGIATLIREYWEDCLPGRPLRSIDIYLQVRNIAELVLHASSFANRLAEATRIHFSCEWTGLKGRHVWSSGIPFFSARIAEVDRVATSGSWAAGTISKDLDQIVAALASRMGRAFNVDITPSYVAASRGRWKKD